MCTRVSNGLLRERCGSRLQPCILAEADKRRRATFRRHTLIEQGAEALEHCQGNIEVGEVIFLAEPGAFNLEPGGIGEDLQILAHKRILLGLQFRLELLNGSLKIGNRPGVPVEGQRGYVAVMAFDTEA